VQSTSSACGGAGVAFGDGLACLEGVVLRLASVPIANGAARVRQPGGTPLAQPGIVAQPGSTRTCQVVYGDPGASCTRSTTHATNGRVLTWTP
jgi:hypothetical protein